MIDWWRWSARFTELGLTEGEEVFVSVSSSAVRSWIVSTPTLTKKSAHQP
jgi:hypothetical protein